ncbi:hypothetical protein ACFQY0_18080 [Haloferula chungangensis]|uniref:Uncharacterized protein n=1 Tax=Haloferula chungangensis TaxID=1048331 RepID=A0ABW2LDR8_9BACT
MKSLILALTLLHAPCLHAGVDIDIDALGESLGGWKNKTSTVDYSLSGADYRTYKPEITPTPDGGIFVSLRIDHRRGWLANDDHAVLEVSFGPDGTVASAQSNLAIQGRTISSDLIRSTANAGASVSGVEGAVKIGTDLVADLSSKLLREKVVEAGRVNFPAVLRHNYNLLFQSVRLRADKVVPIGEVPADPPKNVVPPKTDKNLEIRPYGEKEKVKLKD